MHVLVQYVKDIRLLCYVEDGLDNFEVGVSNVLPAQGSAVSADSYTSCGTHNAPVGLSEEIVIQCTSNFLPVRYVIIRSLDETPEQLCMAEVAVYAASQCSIRLHCSY